jgi:poly(A) polymerase
MVKDIILNYLDTYKDKTGQFLQASSICYILQKDGFEAVLAGGCVRDILSDRKFNDIDIATNATPEQIQKSLFIFKTKLVGEAFGVVLVKVCDYEFEIATFRQDIGKSDGRHPLKVQFCSMEEDAKRRDFTINAIFIDPISYKIYDFVGGVNDIKNNKLKFVGNCSSRLEEDYLRSLRYIRFMCNTKRFEKNELNIVNNSLTTVKEKISKERIIIEFKKIFAINSFSTIYAFIGENRFTNLIPVFFSDIEKLKGVQQHPIYHPEGDVYTHSILVWNFLNMKNTSFLCQIAGLFHDTGKAYCTKQENGRIISHGHEKISTEIVERWMKEYKFSNDEIEYVLGIVSNHMKFHQDGMSNATLRKLMVKPYFNELIIHVEADIACSNNNFETINKYKDRIKKLKESKLPDKLFTGKDLIQLGLIPGEQFGEIIKEMYDAQLNGEFNNKADAWQYFFNNFKNRLNILK